MGPRAILISPKFLLTCVYFCVRRIAFPSAAFILLNPTGRAGEFFSEKFLGLSRENPNVVERGRRNSGKIIYTHLILSLSLSFFLPSHSYLLDSPFPYLQFQLLLHSPFHSIPFLFCPLPELSFSRDRQTDRVRSKGVRVLSVR